jgi:murein DD-endopeptidase MepM/ murein hydrolase activator NlpD
MGGRGIIGLALAFFLTAISHPSQASTKTIRSPSDKRGAARGVSHRDIILEPGASLDLVLAHVGIDPTQRRAAEAALQDNRDARRLQAGTRIHLTLRPDREGKQRLVALHIDLDRSADLTLVAQGDESFDPTHWDAPARSADDGAHRPDLRSVTGSVGADFDKSLVAAGLPSAVAREVRDIFVYDPDFPSSPPVGTRFTIVFQPDLPSSPSRNGDALHSVSVTIRGRAHSVYRYPLGDGLIAFVEPNGRGVLQAHLAAPVIDARISSPWGWRIHPVLDRPEFHKGIDLAAPLGTPVLAAADGTVAFAGRHGNNGVFIKLEHTGQLMTAYSHLQRIAAGVSEGSHVTKGQVIGYVGETGLATGPHLYYEVFVAGAQVNPAKSNVAVPIHIAGGELRRLRKEVMADTRATFQ